ncbi:MAG: carboxypeptidase regulatory-like domain-containing protein [Saprospiraceae bacterium]|nr:carboxypeptidase regulatory-like domain-containing protein [Pyrinomonadaceae bacterium]
MRISSKAATLSFLLFLIVSFFGQASGQNCIDLGGANPSVHSQNFDGLGNSPSPQNGDASNIFILNAIAPRRYLGKFDNAVADNAAIVNVPGWALVEEGSNISSVSGRYNVGDGSVTGGNTMSFASAAANTDRAFGSLNDDSVALNFLGGCFRNTSGIALTAVTIAFTGEMWRLGGSGTADRLDFQYAVNAANLYAGTFSDFDALDFATPNLSGTAGARDGNAAANRQVFSLTALSVSLAPNDALYIRWQDSNITGADDGLAVDDFSLQLVGPSAAGVSVGGRVMNNSLRGVSGARVSIMDSNGTTRLALTNPFGYYNFHGIQSGETYVVSVMSKRYMFSSASQTVTPNDDINSLDFFAN